MIEILRARLACSVLLILCASAAQAQIPAASAAGCYRFVLSERRAAPPAGWQVDTVVARLDTVPRTSGRNPRDGRRGPQPYRLQPSAATLKIDASGRNTLEAWWSIADSLFLQWSSGFQGILISARGGDTLRGWMRYATDRPETSYLLGPVTGARVACAVRVPAPVLLRTRY